MLASVNAVSGQRETTSSPLADTPLDLHFSSSSFSAMEGIPAVSVCVDADNPEVIAGRTISVIVTASDGTAAG